MSMRQTRRGFLTTMAAAGAVGILPFGQAGMIKSTPQRILADGTNWRFFDELKRGLKA